MQRITKSSEEKPSRTANRSYRLAARSCIACHRRKVRCDRGVPCTNCTRCEFTCVYPKETAEKRPASLQHVSDRLERVESMLARFCETQLSDCNLPSAINEPNEKTEDGLGEGREADNRQNHHTNLNQGQSTQRNNMSWEVLLNDGHVVQYVNNPNIKDLLQDEDKMRATPSPSNHKSPPNLQTNNSHAIPTPIPTPAVPPNQNQQSTILACYPTPELALHLWSIYSKSVDPVLKILHKPTTQSAVLSTILDPTSATRSMLALTYAIYYAAITALCHNHTSGSTTRSGSNTIMPEHCQNEEERTTLLSNYKSALDTILLSTDLMNSPDLTSLQALAIYATTLRTHSPTRSVWVLTGLTIRLSQSIGLHRNGTDLNLSPFETELRLRLWWHLCVLDSRAPEDQGFEISVDIAKGQQGQSQGLRLPLNVNDDQLFPGMRDFPVESVGWTEMSFFLMQTESCRLLSPVLGPWSGSGAGAGTGAERGRGESISEIRTKRAFIEERRSEVFAKYGISEDLNLNDSAPAILSKIAGQHLTTAKKKMEFILQLREESILTPSASSTAHSKSQSERPNTYTQTQTPKSFTLACDAIDSNRLLLQSSFSHDFRWLFTTYTQWYALAYILRCLCNVHVHVPREVRAVDIQRAWALVDDVFPDMSMSASVGGLGYGGSDVEQHGMDGAGAGGNSGTGTSNNDNDMVKVKPFASVDAGAGAGAGARASSMDVDFAEFDMQTLGDGDFSAFSGFAADIPFLPEWNAIMNGCFDEMGESVQV
ncbi:hypothetical protein N7481_007113 [Penicillium waksmanii]|uniref:uncharacterized protein n=1 Tax=Penicillium waksmanii TaxID=69791 RepID=UPI002547FB99|nr:uncharacterized protein N7481_007113 [Penicillium waksmanii]KAJ5979815.1 hypothetical protein N7481_007113 [Penicillium waksmanii]